MATETGPLKAVSGRSLSCPVLTLVLPDHTRKDRESVACYERYDGDVILAELVSRAIIVRYNLAWMERSGKRLGQKQVFFHSNCQGKICIIGIWPRNVPVYVMFLHPQVKVL